MTGTVGSPYLTNWLSQGYAIVATDYVGLGTPGIHAYLDGPSAAHSVIDMVRAARAVGHGATGSRGGMGERRQRHRDRDQAPISSTPRTNGRSSWQ